jgi:stalled ribosome alternative rescue factor ArfA
LVWSEWKKNKIVSSIASKLPGKEGKEEKMEKGSGSYQNLCERGEKEKGEKEGG